MSVRLTPGPAGTDTTREDTDEHACTIPNGEWKGLTSLAAGFGEDVAIWNGHHDPLFYTPEQLRAIARRVDQINAAGPWLRAMADKGGATLS
jgi:hypothetical protein